MLHLGDLRTLAGGFSEGVTDDLDFRDVFGEVSDEFVVDTLLDEDAGCGAADLSLVVEDSDVLCMLECVYLHRNVGETYSPLDSLVKLSVIENQ